jgi:xanthine dehydrogenase YagS FAD-binding subunit
MNAILGWSESCIAVHPSDMCVALAVLEATVFVTGPKGDRAIPFVEFHRLPGDTPERDTNLAHDEIIVAIELPREGFNRNYSYLKIRDRLSYAFALVSVAVGLDLDGVTIKSGRVALGGVAHKPWRVPEAERLLNGQRPDRKVFGEVADIILRGASGFAHNSFKIELARRAIMRTLEQAGAGTPQSQSVKSIV